MWPAKTGGCCLEERLVKGVVRFGKVDKGYIQRNYFLPRQLLQPTNHKDHIGGIKVRPETTPFLRQNPHPLAVLAEAVSDDLQQYFAGVCYLRDVPVVAALCPILRFMEYHDNGTFSLLRHLAPPPNTNDNIDKVSAQDGIIVEGDLNQFNGYSVRFDSLSERKQAGGACQLLHRGLNS